MKYVPPYGRETEGDSASYINGNPATGQQGSIPPANAFEHPMREIVHVIEKNQFLPDSTDLYQLIKATRSQRANFAIDTGSANNISVALDPPLAAYSLGLVLRVQIKTTNTLAVRINAGAGQVPVRKMSGADVGPGELTAGGIATMVFDGTVFQLSNFGGAGGGTGGGTVYEVKIPYCVDTSTTPGIITANFAPAITSLSAGDEVAVKVANTAPGPTIMNINGLPAIQCTPNGGGEMLQGDMHAGNVMIFFYDGSRLYFQPDPFIDANVSYTVGPGQHWATVAQAMQVLARKAIGPSGNVTLQFGGSAGARAIITESIVINHPSADRITLAGTMIGANPQYNDFAQRGGDPTTLAQDAVTNINMLRSRYGTEIQIGTADASNGINNNGPGQVTIRDLLIVGAQFPPANPSGPPYKQWGVHVGQGKSMYCYNVSVWGAQAGWKIDGFCSMTNCWTSACGNVGFECDGGNTWATACGAFGTTLDGWLTHAGQFFNNSTLAQANGRNGMVSVSGGEIYAVSCWAFGNYSTDVVATTGGVINLTGCTTTTASPAKNTNGNVGALITDGPMPTAP